MELDNIANWTNTSDSKLGVLNNSFASVEGNDTKKITDHAVAFFVCLFGLPGNLLIMAVYVRKMSTSTRLYMFSLAVADTAVCLCGVVLITSDPGVVTMQIVIYVFDMSTSFSVFLLVFVSIERLLAVRRPHSFTIKAQRAKTALKVIAITAGLFTTATTVASLKQYLRLNRVFEICTLCVCVITMTTCYSLTAATLVNKVRTHRNRVAALNRNRSLDRRELTRNSSLITTVHGVLCERNEETTCSHFKTNVVRPHPDAIYPADAAPVNVSTTGSQPTPAQSSHTTVYNGATSAHPTTTNNAVATHTKNVTLLFIVTVVFIASWMPKWMATMGVPIPKEVKRSFVINSFVNPFIYSVASAMFREDVRQFYRHSRDEVSRFLQCEMTVT